MQSKSDSPFSESIPNLQKAWDSTSLRALQECPRKYQLAILQGHQKPKLSPPLWFGIHYHKALELYQKDLALGKEVRVATRSALRYAFSCLDEPEGDTYRNRFNLVRSVAWYIDHWKDDPAKVVLLGADTPAVELSFRYVLPIDGPDGEPYLLCGHLDTIVDYAGQKWITDKKSTKYTLSDQFFERFHPDTQISLYDYAGDVILDDRVAGIMIDGAQIAVNFTTFRRQVIDIKPGMREEFIEEIGEWIRYAEFLAERNYYPRNFTSCHKYSGCVFLPICRRDPSVREDLLKSEFTIRHWNPLENRDGE